MKAKTYLEQVGRLERRISERQAEAASLEDSLKNVSPPASTDGSDEGELLPPGIDPERLREQIRSDQALFKKLLAQVMDVIAGLEGEEASLQRQILRYVYIDHRTLTETTKLVYMSYASVRRYHHKALECLCLPADPVTIDEQIPPKVEQ